MTTKASSQTAKRLADADRALTEVYADEASGLSGPLLDKLSSCIQLIRALRSWTGEGESGASACAYDSRSATLTLGGAANG
jgi:hypothetical protein